MSRNSLLYATCKDHQSRLNLLRVEVLIYANGILKWSWSCPRATEIASADAQFLFRSALNTSKMAT